MGAERGALMFVVYSDEPRVQSLGFFVFPAEVYFSLRGLSRVARCSSLAGVLPAWSSSNLNCGSHR